jgi:hypothetical protein
MSLKSCVEDVCPCCARYRHVTPFKLTTPTKDLSILGIGVPLFFQYIKYCMNILMTLTIIYCFYNLGYSTGDSNNPGTSKLKRLIFDKSRFETVNHTDKLLSIVTVIIIIILKCK